MRDSHRKSAVPGRLLRRPFALACLASLLLCSESKATLVLDFGQFNASNTPVALNNGGAGSSTLTATDVAVTISTYGGLPSATPAFETLNATSVGAASTVAGQDVQAFNGSVSFFSGLGKTGIDYMTATFTNMTFAASLSGQGGHFTAALEASTPPPSALVFTTSGPPNALPANLLGTPRSMTLSFSGLTAPLAIFNGSLGASGTTSMSNAGDMNAFPVVIPEPSTLAIAGIGGLGLIGYGLRRRRTLGT